MIAHKNRRQIQSQSKCCSRTSPTLSICHMRGWDWEGTWRVYLFLCVPLAATVEVSGTVAISTASGTWGSILKLESSQKVLLSVAERLQQSQLPVLRVKGFYRNPQNHSDFLFIFPESALFYCYTEQEFLNNGGSGVFRGQEGVLNLQNSVLCNKRQQRLPQQHY